MFFVVTISRIKIVRNTIKVVIETWVGRIAFLVDGKTNR